MNHELYLDWIDRTCPHRRASLAAALPKLVRAASERLPISTAGGTIYTVGEESASQSVADYLAAELLATKPQASGTGLGAMSVSVPNLLAYDDPVQQLTASLHALVGPSDALLVFPSASATSYLLRVLENLKRRPAYLFFIGFHRFNESALWCENNFSLEEITPRDYIELQLGAANLPLFVVNSASVPHRAPAL